MAGEQGRAEVAKDLKEQAARTFDDPKLRRLLKELKGVTQQEQRASATRSERQGSWSRSCLRFATPYA
jgi:hypothetical protein